MSLPKVIINRSGPLLSEQGWIYIVPKGELPNSEAGITQLLDDKSLDSILANIEQDKNRLGDKWPSVYAGREHFIYDSSQDSAALAWFTDFEKRDDGIWADASGLTPDGRDAIRNRLYKFTSFVSHPADLEKIPGQSVDGLPLYRVRKIETVGFTNLANGKDLLTPITNRQSGRSDAGTADAASVQKEQDARRTADSVANAKEFFMPDLERWFAAVDNIRKIALDKGCLNLDWTTAWNMAKERHPEIYAAAFGGLATGAGSDDVQKAASDVSKISNRIRQASGRDFTFAWNFVRDNLPRVFNRMTPPAQRVHNRSAGMDMAAAVNAASRILVSLAAGESAMHKTTLSQGMQMVTNRHPGLSALARGQTLLSEAERMEPGIRALIQD